MTSYDRGGFVASRTLTIEPCANGTFLIRCGGPETERYTPMISEIIAFSSSQHMLDFLRSEFEANMAPNEMRNMLRICAELSP